MIEPIKAGDICVVVDGLAQAKSPNIGKIVNVKNIVGEHSRFGRVFNCTGEDLLQLADNGSYVVKGWGHFPAKWLKRINPSELKKEIEKVFELEE